MMKRFTYLFMVLIVVACSSIDCPVDAIVETKYQICNSDGTELKLTDTMTIVSKRLDGRDTSLLDPVVYNKGIGISVFSIPISYSHPEDVLVFRFDNSNNSLHVKDTVWIKKEDYPHFESVDCSASFFHELKDVRCTRNYIDKIEIKNTSVTYDKTTVHFLLYPKTGL